MTAYQETRTHVPPVLAIENGQLVIKLIHGETTLVGSVGDGLWFFGQVAEMLINPALRAAAAQKENFYASPND